MQEDKRQRRTLITGIGALAMQASLVSLQGCGGDGTDGSAPPPPPPPGGNADTTPPTVLTVFPGNGAETSDLGVRILVTFSESVDASSLSTTAFVVTNASSGAAVAGSVSVSGASATFAPSAALSAGATYQVRVTTAARDLAGNALAAAFTSNFSTAAAAVLPTLGAHGLAFKNDGPTGSSVTVQLGTTQASRSTILVCVGRGIISSHRIPTDTKGNSYSQLDSAHAYVPRWPNSGTALYASALSTGGAAHAVTVGNSTTPTDEVTAAVVEVRSGGNISVAWNEVQSGDPVQSLSITTAGPATLVAFWWGDADGSVAHTATPGNGFTRIDAVLAAGSLVQCAVATREVQGGGTYSVAWTATPQQGAQLWLVAVQASP
jgi:hypothetical protein